MVMNLDRAHFSYFWVTTWSTTNPKAWGFEGAACNRQVHAMATSEPNRLKPRIVIGFYFDFRFRNSSMSFGSGINGDPDDVGPIKLEKMSKSRARPPQLNAFDIVML